jgi:hypothetical protein
MNRQSIEKRIIAASLAVDNLQAEWYKSTEYETFLNALRDLRIYYESNIEDDQISLAVVDEYTSFMRMLRGMFNDKGLSSTARERVWDELEGLDYFMEEIVRAVIRDD